MKVMNWLKILTSLFLFFFFLLGEICWAKNMITPSRKPPLPFKKQRTTTIPKYQRGKLVNLLVGGYRIPAPNTLEITISAVSGPNNGRLTYEEEKKTEVVIFIPMSKKFRKKLPSVIRKSFLLSNPQAQKKYLYGSTIYTIRLTNITSGGVFKAIVDPSNRIPEQNENDNRKTFKISESRLSPTAFAKVDLSIWDYRIVRSRCMEVVITAAPKLSFDEERKAQVVITLPDGSKRNYILSDRRINKKFISKPAHIIRYTIRLNITSGGEFKVEVDPQNLIAEWDENNNVKIFNIPTKDVERRWEAELNLRPEIYVKRMKSHTVVFEVRNWGRKLRPNEERNCKVRITYPNNQLVATLNQFNKHQFRDRQEYRLEISNILKDGTFEIEVDTDNILFERNENDNVKRVVINTKELSNLIVTYPSSPLTLISGGTVNVKWRYRRPTGFVGNDFYVEIINSSGKKIKGPTIYNSQNYSYQVHMPFNLGTYRIKIYAPDYYNSYGVSAPIRVIPATFSNPLGFKITSTPSVVSNNSVINISWEVDLNKYWEIIKIEKVRPDLRTSLGCEFVNFKFESPSGTIPFRIHIDPANFEDGKANIFLKFYLHRKGIDQVDVYITRLITVR